MKISLCNSMSLGQVFYLTHAQAFVKDMKNFERELVFPYMMINMPFSIFFEVLYTGKFLSSSIDFFPRILCTFYRTPSPHDSNFF